MTWIIKFGKYNRLMFIHYDHPAEYETGTFSLHQTNDAKALDQNPNRREERDVQGVGVFACPAIGRTWGVAVRRHWERRRGASAARSPVLGRTGAAPWSVWRRRPATATARARAPGSRRPRRRRATGLRARRSASVTVTIVPILIFWWL